MNGWVRFPRVFAHLKPAESKTFSGCIHVGRGEDDVCCVAQTDAMESDW